MGRGKSAGMAHDRRVQALSARFRLAAELDVATEAELFAQLFFLRAYKDPEALIQMLPPDVRLTDDDYRLLERLHVEMVAQHDARAERFIRAVHDRRRFERNRFGPPG